MGIKSKVEELEREILHWKRKARIADEVRRYLEDLSQLPDDAVLLYTMTGIEVQHEIGKSAKAICASSFSE